MNRRRRTRLPVESLHSDHHDNIRQVVIYLCQMDDDWIMLDFLQGKLPAWLGKSCPTTRLPMQRIKGLLRYFGVPAEPSDPGRAAPGDWIMAGERLRLHMVKHADDPSPGSND